MRKAFDKYLQYGGKYCMRKEVVTPEQAMKLLTSSGAWPCLAHPMQYHLGYDQIRVLVGSLKEQGLRGLEVYHSSQNPYQSSKLRVGPISMAPINRILISVLDAGDCGFLMHY